MLPVETVLGRSGIFRFAYAIIGWYRLGDGRLVLIDSGYEESPELAETLAARGQTVAAVINTHLHYDHTANNAALQRKYGAAVYAARSEIENTPDEGQDYRLTPIEDGARTLAIGGASFALLPTPGHSAGHLSVATPDGFCFLGDAVMSAERIESAKLPYMEDVDRAILSMVQIRDTRYPFYAAAHRDWFPQAELGPLIEKNIRKELELYDVLKAQAGEAVTQDALTERFKHAIGLPERYWRREWVEITIRRRIEALLHAGELRRQGDLIVR